jgi:phosphoglycerate dehydrogenase-like enzyme
VAWVDQRALVESLRTGYLGGAGLDVFDAEPMPLGDPLVKLDNVVVAPDLA